MAKKILLAEDEVPMATVLAAKLESGGFDVVMVNDGQSAIDQIRQEKFDMILLDLMMPLKSGFEVLEVMKKENIQMPVMIMSNLSSEDDYKKAVGYGVKDYFIKSDVTPSTILEAVNSSLGNS